MSNSFYFVAAHENSANTRYLKQLEEFAKQSQKQLYVLQYPLVDKKYREQYLKGYAGALLIAAPGHKLIFVDFENDEEKFEIYQEDFIEDLASISDKFRYKEEIGRPRRWKKELITDVAVIGDDFDLIGFIRKNAIVDPSLRRRGELLISLLTGSINDVGLVHESVPDTLLDKVKQKIVLFDGDQTRFVYAQPAGKKTVIQGLSGTGKTELLLHKIKELYQADKDGRERIAFTCHNKILSRSLKNRIPEFFNFMKVEEQIAWEDRLWCFNAWGSEGNSASGFYAHICKFYEIRFYNFKMSPDFDRVCLKAIEEITEEKIDKYGYAFDYVLVDESQDFKDSFFDLCEKVTSTHVYKAGDIFQSIFDNMDSREIAPDFLLSKCYRTDPRTLMFAHSLGMGLFEDRKLKWLQDKEWAACGYIIEREENSSKIKLTREPLRRFEDLQEAGYRSVELDSVDFNSEEAIVSKALQKINAIIQENPTVTPDDIGVIFLDQSNYVYRVSDLLAFRIRKDLGWSCNKAHESREKRKDTLFISNRNHVKGLEFPFVLCFTNRILSTRSYRNALYTMLTRSFLRSYLLISDHENEALLNPISQGLERLYESDAIVVDEPTAPERARIKTTIEYDSSEKQSYYDFVHEIFDELNVMPLYQAQLYERVNDLLPGCFDREKVYDYAKITYRIMVDSE